MPRHTYRHSDLEPLTGSIRALESIDGLPCIEIRLAGEAFTLLAAADDVPPPLRRYYAKVGKKLTALGARLKQYLHSAEHAGWKLAMRINSTLDHLVLTDEDLAHLSYVNNRLLELEKLLKQMVDGMRERLKGLDPSGVEWDVWDDLDIILWLRIGPDPERPTYDPEVWAEAGLMQPLEIKVKVWQCWERETVSDKKPWGLDDGQNHSDMGGCEGHPLQHFSQSYLFHELFDHANVGVWGMLHLQSIWIEIIPHRSGDFVI